MLLLDNSFAILNTSTLETVNIIMFNIIPDHFENLSIVKLADILSSR